MSPITESFKKRFGNHQLTTTGDPCWVPPAFPKEGRLLLSQRQVNANIIKIDREEALFRQESRRQKSSPCCKSLHISLFFDGTNNNALKDTACMPPHPSNVAKLYRACAPDDLMAISVDFTPSIFPALVRLFRRLAPMTIIRRDCSLLSAARTVSTGGWCSFVMP
ncbi:TPA: hypothetical protein ACGZ5T_002408 [Klebsiella oxytoca]